MFKNRLHLMIVFVLLMLAAGKAAAQNAPQAVVDAINDYNTRQGTQYNVNNIAFLWEERLFNNEALGCGRLDSRTLTPKSILGFQVTLQLGGGVEYDYRISYSPAILILCSPYTPPTATPLPTVPTAIPTATVFVPAAATAVPSATVFVPIPPTATPAGCAGLTPRLQIGIQARVMPGGANNLREFPAASTRLLGTIPAEGVFIVRDGPRCTGDGTWWQVDFNGTVGWTVEGNNGDYFLEPLSLVIPPTALPTALPTMTPPPVICDAAIPPRLRIGQQGRVTVGGVPNNIREQPGRSARLIGEIPPAGVFTVLDGPRCTGDGAWFQVSYGTLTGWTIEGMEGAYWLEPPLALEPITPENAARLRPLPGESAMPGLPPESGLIGISGSLILTDGRNTPMRWLLTDGFAAPNALTWQGHPFTGANRYNTTYIPAKNYSLTRQGLAGEGQIIILETGEVLATFPTSDVGSSPAFSPNGNWFVMSNSPNNLFVIPLDKNAPGFGVVRPLPVQHAIDPVSFAFSPDSSLMASVSMDKVVVWNTADWSVRTTLPMNGLYLYQTVFSPDNRLLAVSSLEQGDNFGTLRIWDMIAPEVTLDAPQYMAYSGIVFTPDSRFIIGAGGVDFRTQPQIAVTGYIEMWDVVERRSVIIAGSEPDYIEQVMLNAEGTLMVTASKLNNVQVWAVQP